MEIKEILEQIKHEDNPTRSLEVERGLLNEDEMTAEFSASSELPASRWFGVEILDHKETSIRWHRLKDGASVRDEHFGDQIGVIEKAWIDGNEKKMRVKVRYSKNSERAKEIYKDIQDGIRRNVSIGYEIHKLELESQDKDNGLSVYRVTDWEPVHVAHVADPLDYNVGIGRSNKLVTDKKAIEDMVNQAIKDHENKITINQKGENTMSDINVDETKKLAEQQRLASIDSLAAKYGDKVKNAKEIADLYKSTGRSFEEYGKFVTEEVVKTYQESTDKPTISLSENEKREYSLSRAIKSIYTGGNSLELEISAEYSKISGITSERPKNSASFFMPHSVAAKGLKRDVTAGTATGGAEFVATEHLGGNWIDALLARIVLQDAGVIYLPGRKGNIEIPKLTTGNTFGWASTEAAATSESTPVTTEVTMSPKRGGTFVDITKQAIIQSDPALDVVLTNNGQAVMARGFENAALHGTGSGGQFTGIVSLSSVNNGSLATATWQSILDSIKEIKTDKADIGELVWITNATGEAILRGRAKEAGYPVYILGDDDRLAGRRCLITEGVNSNYMFLGSWNQAYMAFWDALDVIVDPYQFAQYGLVRITFNQLADFAVRHDQAFFYASDLS